MTDGGLLKVAGDRLGERDHSEIGPSSFDRVLGCTASAILGRGLPSYTSSWAFEGVVAHHVFESCLRDGTPASDWLGASFEHDEGMAVVVDEEMEGHLQPLLDFVRGFTAPLQLETRLELKGTAMWGWSDILIWDRPLVCMDLKYGAGISVPAKTKQLGCYGLMALIEKHGLAILDEDKQAEEILLNTLILQPRGMGPQLKPHSWSRADLRTLYRMIVRVDEEVKAGKMRFHASEDCRWCRAVAVCPHLKEKAAAAAMQELVPGTGMTQEQLDENYALIPAIRLWVKKTEELMERALLQGSPSATGKVVKKRHVREWSDEFSAQLWLAERLGEKAYVTELVTPAAAEKLLPREKGALAGVDPDKAGAASALVHKVSSGLTIARVEDPRPAVQMVAPRISAALKDKFSQSLLLGTGNKEK